MVKHWAGPYAYILGFECPTYAQRSAGGRRAFQSATNTSFDSMQILTPMAAYEVQVRWHQVATQLPPRKFLGS
jgi:hypothetical protein